MNRICALFAVFGELALALFEVLFQEGVHCHRLFDDDFGGVKVFGLEPAEFL